MYDNVLHSNYGLNNMKNRFKHNYRYLYKKIKQDKRIILDKKDRWVHVDCVIITDYIEHLKHKS